MSWQEAYLALIEQLLLLIVPVAFVLTIYSWFLVGRYRNRSLRLPFILAVICTIVTVCATWLSWTVLYRSRVGPVPLDYLAVTGTAILALTVVPFLGVGYLAYLDIASSGSRYRRRREDKFK